MSNLPYLTNAIAMLDINELSNEQINSAAVPHLAFSLEMLCGERDCVVVKPDALEYVANARIEDTGQFTDALKSYAKYGEEVFFEVDFADFCEAFPFKHEQDILRIGILIIPSVDGYRFQTLTQTDDGAVHYDPYYTFLPFGEIEAARKETVSERYSHAIFESMEAEFPDGPPPAGSPEESLYQDSAPISATLATVGISLLAFKAEREMSRGSSLPVIQDTPELPRIVSLGLTT